MAHALVAITDDSPTVCVINNSIDSICLVFESISQVVCSCL